MLIFGSTSKVKVLHDSPKCAALFCTIAIVLHHWGNTFTHWDCFAPPWQRCTIGIALHHWDFFVPLRFLCTVAISLHHCMIALHHWDCLVLLGLLCTTGIAWYSWDCFAPLGLLCTIGTTLHHCNFFAPLPLNTFVGTFTKMFNSYIVVLICF